ncbi:MAG: hypothetical protein JO089_07955 [Alphaproteobacteria bacterium]|nr:hypothetical protein [Alphaproteobacteria bacterium]
MEICYGKDIDPASLNGFAATHEATAKAAPLAFAEAYRMAKAYHTPLVGEHNGRLAYIDPHKYSLEDILAGRWKSDPGIYEWHAADAG